MLRLVRSLPAPVEFAAVITIAFGSFIYYSAVEFLGGSMVGAAGAESVPYETDASLIALVVHEIVALVIVAVFLRMRGWSLNDFDMRISWRLSAVAVLLFVLDSVIYHFSYQVIVAVSYAVTSSDLGLGANLASSGSASVAGAVSLSTIILLSTVNPIFEEVLVVGYVMTVIQRRQGMWLAINISTLIRLSYHLYQGPFAIISIVPMGLLFGYYYARTGRLWPLILAHAMMNFIPLYAIHG
jgi:membrane protease YdiL (CAAX protease family)